MMKSSVRAASHGLRVAGLEGTHAPPVAATCAKTFYAQPLRFTRHKPQDVFSRLSARGPAMIPQENILTLSHFGFSKT